MTKRKLGHFGRIQKKKTMKTNQLYHHGIFGQKWGKRNGPPYPIGASDHSASEKKAGWRKSLNNGRQKEYNKSGENDKHGLTDRQKTIIKVGAAAAVTALAAYGTYRLVESGKLDGIIANGKNATSKMLSGSIPAGSAKKLPKSESLLDSVAKANPLRGTEEGDNNCVPSAIAGCLRQLGFDVTAKGTGGKAQNCGGVLEECFKNIKVLSGSAVKFGKSPSDAAEMLKKRYGDNAFGVCNIQWKGTEGGHAFGWRISEGVVSFFDPQQGTGDNSVKRYWNLINPFGSLDVARLDDAEINWSAVSKYINL